MAGIADLIASDPAAAVDKLRAAVRRDPLNAEAQRLLGRALRALGRDEEAETAELAAIRAATRDPAVLEIAHALVEGELPLAEQLLRNRLRKHPTDVAAIRMMAELAARLGRLRDAEALLNRALELAPGFLAARGNLATVLYKQNRFEDAAGVLEEVLDKDPASPSNRNLLAAALGRIGNYEESLELFAGLVENFPDHPRLQTSYGHVLKTVGRLDEGVAAYRRALAVESGLGEVWWSLANLKTVRFDDADIAAMEAALQAGPAHDDRLHLHFALGKAYGERRLPAESFRHFAAGNALRREELGYRPERTTAEVDRLITIFKPDFLRARESAGDTSPDPIFIVGLPRAGSTLLEQILSCHSLVEGTMELPDIPAMAMREARHAGADMRDWLGAVMQMEPGRLSDLGAEYLDRTRIQRKTGKPFYIDKLPNNWAYAGLIHLILPNAKIIDARRHPLDCCFSNFRQHFAKGQAFTYGLEDIGRYYADYVRAMDHYDAVLPGRIHRVIHEDLLADPEGQVRAMLAYLGVEFEQACMEFHRSDRAVRTASSEQVRRPINRDGVGQWREYAEWLDPLTAALGDLPETYARR